MKKYTLLFILGLFAYSSSAQEVEWVVEPTMDYDHIYSGSEGLASVQKDGKLGFIDKTGKVVIPLIYDNFLGSYFSGGLAEIEQDDKIGFINKTGRLVVPFMSRKSHNFSEGLASVIKNNKYGFINKKEELVIPATYDYVRDFSEGLAAVQKDGNWSFIDKTGKVAIPIIYEWASRFSEGLARVQKDGNWSFIDKTGKIVIPLTYNHVSDFSEGLAVVEKNGNWSFIDKTGKIVVSLKQDYDVINSFKDGLAEVKKDYKCGFIDKTGKEVIPPIYDDVFRYNRKYKPIIYSPELISIKKDYKYGLINIKGKILIPVIYDYLSLVSDDLVMVQKDSKRGFMDKTGKIVLPLIYDNVSLFSEDLVSVKIDGKWGILKNPLSKEREDEPTIIPKNIQFVWLAPNPDKQDGKSYDSPNLTIELKAFGSTNLKKSDFKVYINNQLQTAKSGEIQLFGTTFSTTVQLEDGKNNIKVCIENNCSKTFTAYYSAGKPNLHLVSIGTNPPDLNYTENDAEDFANMFKSQKGGLFTNIFIERLLGDDATHKNISEQLQMLNYQYNEGEIKPNDVVMLFISSHGYIEAQDNNRFRIQESDFNPAFYKTRSIAYEDIIKELSNINCKKIIWIDACHSGGAKASASVVNDYIQQLNKTYAGITTITSSSRNQKSYEDRQWQNGAFTEALIQGLSGRADGQGTSGNRDGVITLDELYAYISQKVPQIVKTTKGRIQEPQITRHDLGDLPIFVY